MTGTQTRKPSGTPTGGQFVATHRGEAELDLNAPVPEPAGFGVGTAVTRTDYVTGDAIEEGHILDPAQMTRDSDGSEPYEVYPVQSADGRGLAGWSVDQNQRKEIARQIGSGNIMSISGGRVHPIADGIELPVSNGFSVRVHLDPSDTYTVERIFKRGNKEWVKGSRSNVYCDDVSELSYRAGMFRSYEEDEW